MHGFSSSSQPPPASGRVLVSRRASDIQPEAIHWLWPQRIAIGKTCLIAGHPGLGKSQVTTDIAATVSEALSPLTPDDIDTAKETAEACLRVFAMEKATELRSSILIDRLRMHENLFLSDKQLKKRLKLLHVQIHKRNDANYYLKADFVPP
jgi:hypothetical protein